MVTPASTLTLVGPNGGKILVLDQSTSSPEEELTADLLSIIHVFSCRVHGLRKYRNQIKKDSDLPIGGAKIDG